jgi:hypothetical protein
MAWPGHISLISRNQPGIHVSLNEIAGLAGGSLPSLIVG